MWAKPNHLSRASNALSVPTGWCFQTPWEKGKSVEILVPTAWRQRQKLELFRTTKQPIVWITSYAAIHQTEWPSRDTWPSYQRLSPWWCRRELLVIHYHPLTKLRTVYWFSCLYPYTFSIMILYVHIYIYIDRYSYSDVCCIHDYKAVTCSQVPFLLVISPCLAMTALAKACCSGERDSMASLNLKAISRHNKWDIWNCG